MIDRIKTTISILSLQNLRDKVKEENYKNALTVAIDMLENKLKENETYCPPNKEEIEKAQLLEAEPFNGCHA